MSNPTQNQRNPPPTTGTGANDRLDFEIFVRQDFIRYTGTFGIGYNLTVQIMPGWVEIVPGWLHGLIMHLIALANVSALAQGDRIHATAIQTLLTEQYQLIVDHRIIRTLMLEFSLLPIDLQNAWYTAYVVVPARNNIDRRWILHSTPRFNPTDSDDVRRELIRGRLLTTSSTPAAAGFYDQPNNLVDQTDVTASQPSSSSSAGLSRSLLPQQPTSSPPSQQQQQSLINGIATLSPNSPVVRPPTPPAPQRQPSQQMDRQDSSVTNPDSYSRRSGGRLRDISRRVSYALATPRSRRHSSVSNALNGQGQPATAPNTPQARQRSASPSADTQQPPARQRTSLLQRGNTISGGGLTRSISNRIRTGVRRIGFVSARDASTNNGAANGDQIRRLRSPSLDTFIRPEYTPIDRNRPIDEVLQDVGLTTVQIPPDQDSLTDHHQVNLHDNPISPINLFDDVSNGSGRSQLQTPLQPTAPTTTTTTPDRIGAARASLSAMLQQQSLSPPSPQAANANPDAQQGVGQRRSYTISGPAPPDSPPLRRQPSTLRRRVQESQMPATSNATLPSALRRSSRARRPSVRFLESQQQ